MDIEKGVLYAVATPIGNLQDLTPRAADVLAGVDFIAAEDTRVSGKLTAFLGVKKPFVNYFEHNKREMGDKICERLAAGESCALVTDAGTPAISDPGEDLVRLCAERGLKVCPIPGASAVVTALCASGLPTGRFCFEGFLSVNKKSRREHLESLADERRTMVFYEAPHKLRTTLSDLYAAFGARQICLCRELTKLHEQFIRTTLGEAVELYSDENQPRGEFVLVVAGKPETAEEKPLSRNELYRQKLAQKSRGEAAEEPQE